MSGTVASSRSPTGLVVWVTGLPSAGKSKLAQNVRHELARRGGICCVLDGDEVRGAIVPEPGYSPEARDAFYATLARLANLVASQGLCVVVAATAHKRAYRDAARALAPRFI